MTPFKIGWGDLLPLSLIFKSPLLLKCLLKKRNCIRVIEPGQPMSAIRWYTLERRICYRSIVLKVLEFDLWLNSCHFQILLLLPRSGRFSPGPKKEGSKRSNCIYSLLWYERFRQGRKHKRNLIYFWVYSSRIERKYPSSRKSRTFVKCQREG